MATYRQDLQNPVYVVSFGSSVAVGAALPDPGTQAPGERFKIRLSQVLDPAGIYNWQVSNQAVNGSTASDFAAAWAAMQSAGITPKIVVFAYGMNDAAAAQFNTGQTFPGFYSALTSAVNTAHAAGADTIIMTTPHGSIVNYAGVFYAGIPAASYPVSNAGPVSPADLQPSAATSNVTADFLQNGIPITMGVRYLRVNQAMRDVARATGTPLIDVERYWMEAIQQQQIATGSAGGAENALFGSTEFVHPNLLGHQTSYWRGIDDFVFSLAHQSLQP